MARRIELTCGVLAAVIGLMGLTYVHEALQRATYSPLGVAGSLFTPDAIRGPEATLGVMALLLVLLATGAYLQSMHESSVGLALLSVGTVALIACALFSLLSGGQLLADLENSALIAPGSPALFSVLTVTLAVMASVAGMQQLEEPVRPAPPAWWRRKAADEEKASPSA